MNLFGLLFILIFPLTESTLAQSSNFNVKNFPDIEVTFNGKKNAISCKLDPLVDVYICPNEGNPILLKNHYGTFVAIGRDSLDNSAKEFKVKSIKAKDKTVFEEAFYTDFSNDSHLNDKPKEYYDDYRSKAIPINNFFDLFGGLPGSDSDKKKSGSAQYEKLAQSFIEEKSTLFKKASEIATEASYQVELASGTKVNCQRGETNPADQATKNHDANYGTKTQCGIFSCDTIELQGKKYQATLLFDSNINSDRMGLLYLSNNGTIGPSVNVQRVYSKRSRIPLIDNSYFLKDSDKKTIFLNQPEMSIPENLAANKNEYLNFKDPAVNKHLKYAQSICSNKDKTLENLLNVKKGMLEKLSQSELVQFIQIINDNLISYYLEPKVAKKLGCFYNGLYLDPNAAKKIDLIQKNIHPDKKAPTITLNKANELFKFAANMRDLAFNYKKDGCYARAHLMARRFEKKGVRVDKVWIKGELYLPSNNSKLGETEWNFHVAPLVYVQNGQGAVRPMVIDPTLFSKPVSIEEWDKKIAKKTTKGSERTVFPFPRNAAFYERAAIAISTSDVYLDDEPMNMSEAEKMDFATSTLQSYKRLEI